MKRNITFYAPGLVLAAHGAAAMELDTLIPAGLPGLGAAAPLSVIGSTRAGDPAIPIQLGPFAIAPTLTAGAGYDSAPNGNSGAAATLTLEQNFVLTDAPLGFGAVLSGNTSYLPSDPQQDVSGYTAAAGEEAVLPRETVSFVAGYVRRTATGFALSSAAIARPQAYGVLGVSARDKISAGMFTLTPQISYAVTSFDGAPAENVTQTSGRLELDFIPGGATRIVILIEATAQNFRTKTLDAASGAALAGLDEDATGLWDVRLLAGAAWRRPRCCAATIAPVLEAAATWAPTELDVVSLTAAHEIDDPDQVSPDGYMLTQGNLSWTHEAGHDIDLSAAMQASHAAFFDSRRNETLAAAAAGLAWHVSGALALNAAYQFNDRQADFLRAANEQIVTLNAVWTP